MTSTVTTPTGTVRRKRPFPFGLVMLLFGLGLGFYGGIAATKSAMTGPQWVQRIFGIPSLALPPAAPIVQVAPPVNSAPPTSGSPAAPTPPGGAAAPAGQGDASSGKPDPTVPGEGSAKKKPADSHDLVGRWTVTDSLTRDGAAAGSLTSAYVFHEDGSGEFESNGKKLYDLHWSLSGPELSLDFEGDGPEPGQPWNAKMKWSLNDDKSVLTLIPSSGKDPRAFVYTLAPGVYHKKR